MKNTIAKSKMQNIIFIHGLESSGQGFKGRFFRNMLPECLTPDFEEYNPQISIKMLLEKRMTQLNLILKDKDPWIIIGSSFGGLMGALYTFQNPKKVSKLILLAPYLSTPRLNPKDYSPVSIPVIVFHGKHDRVALINQSRPLAEKLFTNLIYNIVNDNHFLHKTVKIIDWKKLIENV
jgi:alpha-beta hydrolase superfamily lysophospholipase